MKRKIISRPLFPCFTVFNYSLKAQIPNANFENWTYTIPSSWSCNNEPVLNFSPVSKTSDAKPGRYAVIGTVKRMEKTMLFASVIYKGNLKDNKFSVTERYSGYYKLKTVKDDQFVASVFMFKNGEQIGKGIEYFQAVKNTPKSKLKLNIKVSQYLINADCILLYSPALGVETNCRCIKVR